MNFKVFYAYGSDKKIKRAGFEKNSGYAPKTFEIREKQTFIYSRDGSVWKLMDDDLNMKLNCMLYRMPILTFEELWELFLNGKGDDEYGARIFLARTHATRMIEKLATIDTVDKKLKKRLKKFRAGNFSGRVNAAIDKLLEGE